MKGWLAPVSEPHVYQHVPEQYHAALHALAQPWTMDEVAEDIGYHREHVRSRIGPAIRRALHIETVRGSEAWRVKLVRLYYGVDRCWCREVRA